ncbi:MAG: baseplate J/gp47 family protein [Alistipes sp.]
MTTTKEISDNIIAQMDATFGSSMPKSFTRVISKVLAGIFVILYKYCGFIFLQLFVSTASMRPTEINGKTVTPLIEWGRLIGAGDPFAATQAELIVRLTTETLGAVIPAASQLVHVASGVTYITTQAVTLGSSTTDVEVIAVSDPSGGGGAGTIGNLPTGASLSFANPLAGVARIASVVSQTVTGANAETEAQYRARVISRFQLRPQGGAYVDYKLWAESTIGVLRAYPYTSENPGQVKVYIESSTEPDGIPTTAQLTEALNAINYSNVNGLATRRPAGALVTTLAIIRVPFSVEVVGLSVENVPVVQADIEAALTKYFVDRAPFLVGLTLPPRLDRITQSAVSGIVDDVVSAVNGIFTEVKLRKSAVITPIYTLGIGEKAKLTGVTYT